MYGRIFQSMYQGSMYGIGGTPFAVWGYVIANVDKKGYLELNPRVLADVIGETEADIKAAIKKLMEPDKRSRFKGDDGRRLVKEGQFLFRVPSYEDYRKIWNEESKREYMRLAQRKHREKQKEGEVE